MTTEERENRKTWARLIRQFKKAASTFQLLPETANRAYYITYAIEAWGVSRKQFTSDELHKIINDLFADDEESISATGSGEEEEASLE
jgi:hypothetical protein